MIHFNNEPPIDPAAAQTEMIPMHAAVGALASAEEMNQQLRREMDGLVNMLVIIIRGNGGRMVIQERELVELEGCWLTSTRDVQNQSIVLQVVRRAPADATAGA